MTIDMKVDLARTVVIVIQATVILLYVHMIVFSTQFFLATTDHALHDVFKARIFLAAGVILCTIYSMSAHIEFYNDVLSPRLLISLLSALAFITGYGLVVRQRFNLHPIQKEVN